MNNRCVRLWPRADGLVHILFSIEIRVYEALLEKLWKLGKRQGQGGSESLTIEKASATVQNLNGVSATESTKGKEACNAGVLFIEEQLIALTTFVTLLGISKSHEGGLPDLTVGEHYLQNKRAATRAAPHAEAGLKLKDEPPPSRFVGATFKNGAKASSRVLETACTNAILAVAGFFEDHNMAVSKAPEVQFLMRIRDAALRANVFGFESDEYIPVATFDGLVISKELNGSPLFGDGSKPGFLECGDVAALLAYLSVHLGGVQTTVSDGDAG